MKLLNSRIHGMIDYAFDLVLLFAPAILNFSPVASGICYTFAVAHFVTSLCTKYELSLFKLIPFTVHGGLELAAALVLMATPWMAEFSAELAARNFYVVMGVALLGVWSTTDYKKTTTSQVKSGTIADELPFRRAS